VSDAVSILKGRIFDVWARPGDRLDGRAPVQPRAPMKVTAARPTPCQLSHEATARLGRDLNDASGARCICSSSIVHVACASQTVIHAKRSRRAVRTAWHLLSTQTVSMI
jgi:hypothetical protein